MSGLRILLAEDDEVIVILLTEILTDLGHDVCAIAATEAELVTAAARHRPDIMLVDVALGTGSGVAGVSRVLQTGPVPHVFMSGGPVSNAPPDAAILAKPFGDEELRLAIARAMQPRAVPSIQM